MEKSLAELKAIASELGITPDGDKRQKDTWIRAIHNRGITVVEPCFNHEKTAIEREREKLPIGARVALMCPPTHPSLCPCAPEQDDRWNPAHFGDLEFKAEENGQLNLLMPIMTEPPDPDDYPDLSSFHEAWDKWEQNNPTPQPEEEEEEPEPPTEPWPFPSKQKKEKFVPKFHQIIVDEGRIIRYRYKIESHKPEWIRWTGTKKELMVSLEDIEASLNGIFTYKNHKIQVTSIGEINYKSPNSNWLNFPLSESEDIQEGAARLTSWIDSLSEADKIINDLPKNSPPKAVIITVKITHGMSEFRRNCTPVAVLTRPP